MGDRQFELFAAMIVFDGLLTVINLAILAIAVKLISEFYKVTRLTPK